MLRPRISATAPARVLISLCRSAYSRRVMARRQIGTVGGLWRYPVKSMRGEPLDEAWVNERGIVGDRVWAVRELERGGIMSARTFPALLDLRACYEGEPATDPAAVIKIELPDGGTIIPEDPQ